MLSSEIQPKDSQEAIEFFSIFERLWFPGIQVSTRSECLHQQLMPVRLLRQRSNEIIFVGIRKARHHGTTLDAIIAMIAPQLAGGAEWLGESLYPDDPPRKQFGPGVRNL